MGFTGANDWHYYLYREKEMKYRKLKLNGEFAKTNKELLGGGIYEI